MLSANSTRYNLVVELSRLLITLYDEEEVEGFERYMLTGGLEQFRLLKTLTLYEEEVKTSK